MDVDISSASNASVATRSGNKKTASWKIHAAYSSGSTRNAQPQHQPPVSQEITPPLDDSFMKSHPNIYYQHQTTEYRSKYAILSLAAPPLPRVLYSIGIGVRT
mmetsp:Transcript_16100/g.23888  ORF Transcript_16100/g.23888 Transcript_16100/m.23888 type:complete len:103 (+) Transcript_16100:191-499(+)